MSEQVRVTTTPDVVLRHAIELAEPGPENETFWEKQARTLDEIGYAVVGKDELAQLRATRQRALEARAWELPDPVAIKYPDYAHTVRAQRDVARYIVGEILDE